jgi:hypothetical protein
VCRQGVQALALPQVPHLCCVVIAAWAAAVAAAAAVPKEQRQTQFISHYTTTKDTFAGVCTSASQNPAAAFFIAPGLLQSLADGAA